MRRDVDPGRAGRDQEAAQPRLAILEAAYAEFSARAYSAVSLDDIAGRAGFSSVSVLPKVSVAVSLDRST